MKYREDARNGGTRPGRRHDSGDPLIAMYALLAITVLTLLPFSAGYAGTGAGVDPSGKLPAHGNAVWIYDPPDKDHAGNRRRVQAGAHVPELSNYNHAASEAHRLSIFYSMGGSLELYCDERGTPEQSCRDRDLVVTYDPEGNGHHSARSYREGVDISGRPEPIVTPIIDGLVNADYEGSMKGFDQLSREEAERLADKVSERVCADTEVDGIQFDVEPFNVDERHGQFFFYRRIASNFAGVTGDYGCVSDTHPHGRVFSIFTTARRINPETESANNVAEILNRHRNGYLVGALYDLGKGPPGTQTSLEEYQRLVRAETRNMHVWAKALGISYRHAIPASAGFHEFEDCRGPRCQKRDDGPTQLDYVRVALQAIHDQPQTERFLGVALWAWGAGVSLGETQLYPNAPPPEVRAYLADHLGGSR